MGINRKVHNTCETRILKLPLVATGNNVRFGSKAIVLVQKIKIQQMKERRDKGLCCYYNSKWNPGHKCQQPKLFLIDEVEEESVDVSLAVEENESEEIIDLATNQAQPEISLNALIGSLSTRQ